MTKFAKELREAIRNPKTWRISKEVHKFLKQLDKFEKESRKNSIVVG